MYVPSVVLATFLLYHGGSCYRPEVTIQQGTLRGLLSTSVSGREYYSFIGVPYAKPPVGKHRFKEPVPPDPWLGTYNATMVPHCCLQYDHFMIHTENAVHGSEDCLYINVYTPRLEAETPGQKPLDVIAFIHGGAFMFYNSNDMGASYLLDRDVVLVSFNYRLGSLGFLSTGDSVVPGNNGMKDQVLALKWIQQNIRAFGGNPDSVTIAGFSAGGASVHYHLLSPLSKGLFKNAIIASGTALNSWTIAENAREKALFVSRELGCPIEDSLSMIKCLRNRPAEHIVGMSRQLMPWLYHPFSPYALVVEPPGPNAFLPDSPINIIKQGKAADVPTLFTFTKEEGLYPGTEIIVNPENLGALENRWNELLPYLLDYNFTVPDEKTKDEVSQKIRERYEIDLNTKTGPKNLIEAMSDRIFVHGIVKAAKLHATLYKSPVYLYRFSYTGKYTCSMLMGGGPELGVAHVDDILYILPISGLNTRETAEDRQVSDEMIELWLSFASNGTLSGKVVGPDLPKIALTDILGPRQQVTSLVDELGQEVFWDSLNLLENLETFPQQTSHQEL